MTTPTHRRPRRGRMAVAAIAAVVLVVAGLVLFVTAGSNRPGDPALAIAGAPSLTSTTPNAPSLPPLAGAAVGGSVSTPGSDAGVPSDPAVPVPSSGPGAAPAASGVPAPGPANGPGPSTPNGAGQPGSSSGPANGAVPGAVVPGQPGPSSNTSGATPGQPGSSGNTGGATPGGPAGSPGNPGTGISASARAAALSGASTLPPNTLVLPSLGVGPTPLGPICGEPGGLLEPPVNTQGMLCTWRGSSPAAASTGETTLAGHVNYGRIPNAAFAKLAQMHVGDPIFLRGATGGTQTWIVRSEFARSKSLPLDNNAFVGPDGPRSLVLLSCGGNLISGERSYADNIYVYAVPV